MTLRQLVPASLLAGRRIVVLVCYLDDSGKDPQNPVALVAGYIARDTEWERFEAEVEPWFIENKVPILHATDLKGTRGAFAGWPILKKQAFVSRICQARNPHVMLGMSMAIEKASYDAYRKSKEPERTSSLYSLCFNVIVDWIFRDRRLGKFSNDEGVAFILECGHENNAEAQDVFYEVRKRHGLEALMHSISFVPKDRCRAIQLADLYAFYSRRNDVAALKAQAAGKETYPTEMMLRIITQGTPHRGYVATGFAHHANLARPPLFPSDW